MKIAFRVLCAALGMALSACAVTGPVDIDTKADACSRCRMSIDQMLHAGEIVTADGDVRKYDSLGCLLDDYREMTAAGRRLAGAWVIDYATKKWMKAEDGYYALADLPTDHMGFGVAATSSRAGARKIAGGNDAKVVDWKGLQGYRKQ